MDAHVNEYAAAVAGMEETYGHRDLVIVGQVVSGKTTFKNNPETTFRAVALSCARIAASSSRVGSLGGGGGSSSARAAAAAALALGVALAKVPSMSATSKACLAISQKRTHDSWKNSNCCGCCTIAHRHCRKYAMICSGSTLPTVLSRWRAASK